MRIYDKTRKNKVKLTNGWAYNPSDDRTINTGYSISDTDFFFSTVLCFTNDNIYGNGIQLTIGSHTYSIDNISICGETFLFEYGRQYRITIQKIATNLHIDIDREFGVTQIVANDTVSGNATILLYAGNIVYDIRMGVGFDSKIHSNLLAGRFFGEQFWMPMQEGLGSTGVYDVISGNKISTVLATEWIDTRQFYFYNQYNGFEIEGSDRKPNKYLGKQLEPYIYDDEATWFDYSLSQPNHFNKLATVGNTLGLPEYFNSNIYLSQFYPRCVLDNNFFLWNLKELYRIAYEDYLASEHPAITYMAKRLIDESEVPMALNSILVYSRNIQSGERQSIIEYWGQDDSNDNPEIYIKSDSTAIKNTFWGEQVIALDIEKYLKWEE